MMISNMRWGEEKGERISGVHYSGAENGCDHMAISSESRQILPLKVSENFTILIESIFVEKLTF